jgi:ABC-type nitrate/sulfonate/bicarbonate transport system substrate-binding protein
MNKSLNPSLGRRSALKGLAGAGLAAVLAGPLLEACSSSPSSASASGSAKLTTVTCQLGWLKLVQFGGHWAAMKEGYFTQEGISPNFLSGGSNIDAISVVAGGQADIGDANGSDILLAVSTGTPAKAFATIYQSTPNALMSLKSDPVTTLKGMVGKTIGLPSAENSLLKAMLTQAGIDASKVSMVPVGTDPSVLTSKQVQGYIGYGTEQGEDLLASGVGVDIVYFDELGDPDYGNCLFAMADTLTSKKDVITRWLKADLAGWKYFTEHPVEIAEYTWDQYHKQTGAVLASEKTSAAASVPLITGGAAEQHGLMWIEQSAFQTVYDLYKTSGTITKPVNYSDVFTQEFLIASGDKA